MFQLAEGKLPGQLFRKNSGIWKLTKINWKSFQFGYFFYKFTVSNQKSIRVGKLELVKKLFVFSFSFCSAGNSVMHCRCFDLPCCLHRLPRLFRAHRLTRFHLLAGRFDVTGVTSKAPMVVALEKVRDFRRCLLNRL